MRVEELIEKLKECPPQAEVRVRDDFGDWEPVYDVEDDRVRGVVRLYL